MLTQEEARLSLAALLFSEPACPTGKTASSIFLCETGRKGAAKLWTASRVERIVITRRGAVRPGSRRYNLNQQA